MAALNWKDRDNGSAAPASRNDEYRIEIVWGYSEDGGCRYYKPLWVVPAGFPVTTLESAKRACQWHHDEMLKKKSGSSDA